MAEAKEIYEEIDCVLCGNPYQLRPLPCEHTICLPCIDKLRTKGIRKGEIPKCRICRQKILIPESEALDQRQSATLNREFDRLNVAGDVRGEKTTLGTCKVVMSQYCFYVSETPTGRLLVGRNRGFDICNRDGSIARSVTVSTGNISSIQYYNELVYTLCEEPGLGSKRYVIVFDSNTYSEVRRWSVPDYKCIRNIAVMYDMVYVSDPDSKQLCVYSLAGHHIANIEHSTFSSPNYLAISSPDSIIISDYGANKVHKLNSRDDMVTWTCTAVDEPRGACCDTNGDVWVWSDSTKSIFLLSSQTGEIISEIKHDVFTDLDGTTTLICGMWITREDRVLWTAAIGAGLLKFPINRAPADSQRPVTAKTEPDYLVNRKVKEQQKETSKTEPDYLVNRKVKKQQKEASKTEPDYLVNRKVKEQQREFDDVRGEKSTLGTSKVVMSQTCLSVSETPTRRLLVGRKRGFDICNRDGSIARSVTVSTGYIICIQYYNKHVYTLCREPPPSSKRYVVVFDSNTYSEVRRWSVPDCKCISNIAVMYDKVYVSDPDSKQLCVYSLAGHQITNIQHSTFSTSDYLAISSPDSIIISDLRANKVHKLNSRDDMVTWTCTAVDDPRGVCCDTNGDVWVWSYSTKSIFLLSSQAGEIISEIKHDVFTDMDSVYKSIRGMCITREDRVLWAAATRAGLLQFQVE